MIKQTKKILALILSVSLVTACTVNAMTVSATESSNLLFGPNKANYTAYIQHAQDDGNGGLNLNQSDSRTVSTLLNDGVTTQGNHTDLIEWGGGYYSGIVYDLGADYNLSEVEIYALADATYGVSTVYVYASKDTATLGNAGNLIYSGDGNRTNAQKGTVLSSTVTARYVAFFIKDNNNDGRIIEFEAYGTPIVKDPNLLYGNNKANYTAYIQHAQDSDISDGLTLNQSDSRTVASSLNDGVTAQGYHTDLIEWGSGYYSGIVYDLGADYDISEVEIYALANVTYGVSNVYVFASTDVSTLGNISNLIYSGDGVRTNAQKGAVLSSAVSARYVGFFIKDNNNDGRIIEFEVYGSLAKSDLNLLNGIGKVDYTGSLQHGTYNAGTININQPDSRGISSAYTDGVTTQGNHVDLIEWGAGYYSGAVYDLGASYSISEVEIYALANATYGLSTIYVYASDDMSTLGNASNLIYSGDGDRTVAQKGGVLAAAKTARYVGFFVQDNNQDVRIIELEVYGHLASENGYAVNVASVSNGVINVDKTYSKQGEEVIVTVAANSGYKLKVNSLAAGSMKINVRSDEDTTGNVFKFAMPIADVNITAEFVENGAANAEALGAQIRVSQPAGMRFVTRMALSDSATFTSGRVNDTIKINGTTYNVVDYGMILIPTDRLSGDLTVATASVGIRSADMLLTTTQQYVEFTAVLINIPTAAQSRNISARGYIKYDMGNGEYGYYYTSTVSNSYSNILTQIN